MTLTELLIAMSILSIVLLVFLGLLGRMQVSFGRASGRSQTNDQARLAVEELDREIRSGNVLYDPSAEDDPANDISPGMSLRVYTQTNATTRGGPRCVQWRINSAEELQRREWTVNWTDDPDTLVSGWRVVADHVVNRSMSPPVTAFGLAAGGAAAPDVYGSRVVNIDLIVNVKASSGRNVEIEESVTGRNTEFGYPTSTCSSIPPY